MEITTKSLFGCVKFKLVETGRGKAAELKQIIKERNYPFLDFDHNESVSYTHLKWNNSVC